MPSDRISNQDPPVWLSIATAVAEANKSEGGLVLSTREGVRAGGDRGPALVPGDPQASLLLTAISIRTRPNA
jgi:hypothetical protein